MSPFDREVPPTGEEIHVPAPSLLPLLTAVGVTLAIVGVTTYLVLSIIGSVLVVGCVIRWVIQTRRDVDELPLG